MFGKGSSFILIIMTDEWDKTTVEFSSDLFVEGEVAGTFLKTINDLPIRPSERKGRAGGSRPEANDWFLFRANGCVRVPKRRERSGALIICKNCRTKSSSLRAAADRRRRRFPPHTTGMVAAAWRGEEHDYKSVSPKQIYVDIQINPSWIEIVDRARVCGTLWRPVINYHARKPALSSTSPPPYFPKTIVGFDSTTNAARVRSQG